MREIGGKQVDNKRKEREMGIWLTSDSSSFASPSCWAGRPPTSTQLLMTSTSSSSWVDGLTRSSPSPSESSEGERGRIIWSEGQPKTMPMKIGLVKIVGGINQKKKKMLSYLCRCLPAPLPLAPPPSLLAGPWSSLNVPASWHAKHPIKSNWEKTAVNAKRICEMEPLSILWKMVLNDAKVPDDHVIAHMHTPRFRSIGTYFFRGAKIGLQGALFLEFFWQQHRQPCAEQCPGVVITVSILSSTDIWSCSKFPWEHVLEEKKSRWCTFSSLGPASLLYNAKAASPHRNFGSRPCSHV